ncbi:Hypothetical predicted protein [Pelobates cultripes]|uniref:Uncharacterized protein n=1 Tax=Pelobates cultripes TaxID=61616 RepID=A0AAD1SEE9_PELCU|nr:Hypothetical predicted protein [Pelobates cultripes]
MAATDHAPGPALTQPLQARHVSGTPQADRIAAQLWAKMSQMRAAQMVSQQPTAPQLLNRLRKAQPSHELHPVLAAQRQLRGTQTKSPLTMSPNYLTGTNKRKRKRRATPHCKAYPLTLVNPCLISLGIKSPRCAPGTNGDDPIDPLALTGATR